MLQPPPCPYLPSWTHGMSWRDLRQVKGDTLANQYLCALRYAHALWQTQTTARAILALDRALFIPLTGNEPVLKDWPQPYLALHWMLTHHSGTNYLGNPRHHFQHLAGRVSGPDEERKRWVAWACWYITRQTRPELQPDTRQNIREPDCQQILEHLELHGIEGEADTWYSVIRAGLAIAPQTWDVPLDGLSLAAR